MPGQGCQARKEQRKKERRAAKREQEAIEAGEDPEEAALAGKRRRVANADPSRPVDENGWTKVPDMDTLVGEEQEKRVELLKRVAEAVKEYDGGDGVPISVLTADHKVHTTKKDACFNNMRLSDIIEAHFELFQVRKDGESTSKWMVTMIPEAIEQVLGALSEDEEDGVLPARPEAPVDKQSALQALRIEIIRALYKRGHVANLNDIGQEPNINKHRHQWFKGMSLLAIIKMFPENFAMDDQGNGVFVIELSSVEITDTSMITEYAEKQRKDSHGSKGKGCGKGKMNWGMMPPAWMMAAHAAVEMFKGGNYPHKGKGKGKGKSKKILDDSDGLY